MKYLSVLGREPQISLAELKALFSNVQQISYNLATFEVPKNAHSRGSGARQREDERADPVATGVGDAPREGAFLARLGGSLKLAIALDQKPLDFLSSLPAGKITLGVSDYSPKASKKSAIKDALKFKQILSRHGRSVRVIPADGPVLSTATSLHNGLSGKNPRKVELIKVDSSWFKVIGVQDIDAYSRRDQGRPARDAKVGMLPPKLAQILINLCGPLPAEARILDPFCGTGVVLQEALLMGCSAYGTDLNPRMIEYSDKNLRYFKFENYKLEPGDATSHQWQPPITAVACESYLGQPMSTPPADIKLKQEKQLCQQIILGFLKNLHPQIAQNTPVVIAIPAWARPDGTYSRLEILDLLPDMGYNVNNKTREGLLYHREGQIVARDIIILRKK